MKYAVHPGFIVSKNDGDVHFIAGRQLIQLYGLKPQDCLVMPDFGDPVASATAHQMALELNLTHLYPRYDGNYKLPEAHG